MYKLLLTPYLISQIFMTNINLRYLDFFSHTLTWFSFAIIYRKLSEDPWVNEHCNISRLASDGEISILYWMDLSSWTDPSRAIKVSPTAGSNLHFMMDLFLVLLSSYFWFITCVINVYFQASADFCYSILYIRFE